MSRYLVPSIAVLATGALAIGAIACAKTDQSATPAANEAAAGGALAAPHTVTVTAKDYAFEGPSEVPAGAVTFTVINEGKEFHHLQLVQFAEGKTLDDFIAALKAGGPPPAWATEIGGPNAPAPGGQATSTVSLEPGNYAFVCFVDIPDHVPHIMKGMSKAFTVTPSSVATAEPASDATVTLSDYDFALSAPLTAGTRTLRVENGASQPHEIELVQLAPGKTVDDVLAWMDKMQGPPPGKPLGGIAALANGRHGFITVDLAPGEYGLICFLPDAKDGKPHFMHGMKKQLTVS